MANVEYIIVGRDVGQARYHLVGGSYLEASTSPGGTPMDVVHIGKLIAQMSERVGPDRNATAEEKEQIKRCLTVQSVPPGQLTLPQQDSILQNTTVDIIFEDRQAAANPTDDINKRYLVIPADGTIQAALEDLAMPAGANAFEPPLTYPIDEKLMLGFLTDKIVEFVVDTDKPDNLDNMDWTAIKKHLADRLEGRLNSMAQDSYVDQLTAYYRAVGIYATNMCR